MKRILYLLIFSLSHQMMAQNSQLFEHEWYLQSVIINGEEDYPPFPNVIGRVYFENETIEVVHPNCEEGFGKFINYLTNSTFETDDGGVVLLGTCGDPVIIEFQNKHYSIYYNLNTEIAKNPFTYNFTQNNDVTTLTITNIDGDQAIYTDELLSIDDLLEVQVSIYPNPAEINLFITLDNLTDDSVFTIYNSFGNVILRTKPNHNRISKIDISLLTSGIYFLEVTFNPQQKLYKKIMKR